MKFRIDCSAYCDGQGAFKNGMYDALACIRRNDNLYRRNYPYSRINRSMWWLGHWFQTLFQLAYVTPLIVQGRTNWDDLSTQRIFQQQETAAKRDRDRRLNELLEPTPARSPDLRWPVDERLPRGAVSEANFGEFMKNQQVKVESVITEKRLDSERRSQVDHSTHPPPYRNLGFRLPDPFPHITDPDLLTAYAVATILTSGTEGYSHETPSAEPCYSDSSSFDSGSGSDFGGGDCGGGGSD